VKTGRLRQEAWHVALGLAIRRLRRGFSQEEMALAVGLSRSHASKLESGKMSPTFNTLLRLTDWLEMTPAAFMREVQKEYSKL
jgi:transcriptional regulator with XRE-family HTH domain